VFAKAEQLSRDLEGQSKGLPNRVRLGLLPAGVSRIPCIECNCSHVRAISAFLHLRFT
jgi:hypothetical protein